MIDLQSEEEILENKKYMLQRQFEHMMGNLELDFSAVVQNVNQIIEATHQKIREHTSEIENQTIDICIENFHKRFDLTQEEFREDFEFSADVAYNEHAMEAFDVIRTILGVKVFMEQFINDIQNIPFDKTTEHSAKYFGEKFDYEKEKQAKEREAAAEAELEKAAQLLLEEEREQFKQSQTETQTAV